MLEDIGSTQFLRALNSASDRLDKPAETEYGQKSVGTSSMGSVVHTIPTGASSGVQVFMVDNGTGRRWYLRVDTGTQNVFLESQSVLDIVSSCHVIIISNLIFINADHRNKKEGV